MTGSYMPYAICCKPLADGRPLPENEKTALHIQKHGLSKQPMAGCKPSSGWSVHPHACGDNVLLFDFDDLTVLIIAATLANSVWLLHLAAVTADNQVKWLELVMLATATASSLGQLALW